MSLKLLIWYCVLLLVTTICGLVRYKLMPPATRIVVWYVGATCLFESMATGAIYFFKYNLIVYHLYSLIQLLLISLYFSTVSVRFKTNRLILFIGVAGVVLGIINSLFFQSPKEHINTYFFVLEAFLIITMSLYSFLELLRSDDLDMNRSPQFWFSALFMIFWTFTFFYWLVGLTIRAELPENGVWMDIMIWTINILTYAGFALVFFFYKKMKTT